MSRAEDVIAETLNGHEMVRLIGDPRRPTGYLCVGCGTETEPHHAARLQHRAAAVIEAIRNLSPDDLAELIGGEVEQVVNFEHRCIVGRTVIKRFRTNEPWPEQRKETP